MNKLIIATAGAGKTTHLVTEAYNRLPNSVIILTYTEENEIEIRNKMLDIYNCIPSNIKIQTWFSFLIQHGAKPYQGIMHDSLSSKPISGLILVNEMSGVKYSYTNKGGQKIKIQYREDTEFIRQYFTVNLKIYSYKFSKFVIKCNKKTDNKVINRISRIYKHIFIDEVQDLAGNDFEIVKALSKTDSEVFLVGDPRQVTYKTHNERKNRQYGKIGIKQFIIDKCKKRKGNLFEIDEVTLLTSHRNNEFICKLSSNLYPSLPESIPCTCDKCRKPRIDHQGIFLIKQEDVNEYLERYNPTQLRWDIKTEISPKCPVLNFGASKGKTFDRVIIYPTVQMRKWIYNNDTLLADITRAKFYVAITRARYSVAIIYDYSATDQVGFVEKYR